MRFSLLQLLALVTVCGLTLAALVRPTPLAESLFFSGTLLMLLAAAVCAAILTAESRAFWLGFVIASGGYLVLAHVPDEDGLAPRHYGPEFTTQILRLAYNHIHSDDFHTIFSPQEEFPGDTNVVLDVVEEAGAVELEPMLLSNDSADSSLDSFDVRVKPDPPSGIAEFSGDHSLIVGGGWEVLSDGEQTAFMRTGHSAWALLLGWLFGHFARAIYVRTRHPSAPTVDAPPA